MPLAAKPIVATFQPLAAFPLAAGHLEPNRTLAAKPLAATICSGKDKLQRSFAAKYAIAASGLAAIGFAAND